MASRIKPVPAPRKCHDCGAKPGEKHKGGCDVARCPRCGGQAISCNCIYIVNGMNPNTLETEHPDIYNNGPTEAMYEKWEQQGWEDIEKPWSGIWPGVMECREFGWFAKMVPGQGWVQCPATDPDAHENLNRLYMGECQWDIATQRFIKKPVKGTT